MPLPSSGNICFNKKHYTGPSQSLVMRQRLGVSVPAGGSNLPSGRNSPANCRYILDSRPFSTGSPGWRKEKKLADAEDLNPPARIFLHGGSTFPPRAPFELLSMNCKAKRIAPKLRTPKLIPIYYFFCWFGAFGQVALCLSFPAQNSFSGGNPLHPLKVVSRVSISRPILGAPAGGSPPAQDILFRWDTGLQSSAGEQAETPGRQRRLMLLEKKFGILINPITDAKPRN